MTGGPGADAQELLAARVSEGGRRRTVARLGTLQEIGELRARPERIEPWILAGEDAIHDEATIERPVELGKRARLLAEAGKRPGHLPERIGVQRAG